MQQIFILTLQNVFTLLLFIGAGYLLRRLKVLGEDAGRVLGLLCTNVFVPCYTVLKLGEGMRPEELASNGLLVLEGLAVLAVNIPISFFLASRLSKNDLEKATLRYTFLFTNTGYFGYPVIEGVFGSAVLARMIVYLIPISIAINTLGYSFFLESKNGVKTVILRLAKSPMMISVLIGVIIGCFSIPIPELASKVLQSAGSCMSPCSMLLAGVVLGAYPLKKLFGGAKGYLICALRMLAFPAVGLAILYAVGMRGFFLLFPVAALALPMGMNIVVFPQSLGRDASQNARMCFQSTLLSLVTLPFVLSAIFSLSGLG